MLSHNYDYKTTLEISERVGWKLADVIAGRTFDLTRPLLPDSLAGVSSIECLAPNEKLALNHIRGFTYLYLFGFVEEFIVPYNLDHARTTVHGDDHEIRAILRFTEEEAKHIQLFKWTVAHLGKQLPVAPRTIGPAADVVPVILGHSKLGVAITNLCIEWLSQRHYVDGIKGARELDPLFTDILENHWIEEAQHAKLDTLIIDKLAGPLSPAEIERGIDDFMNIGKMLDGAFAHQVKFDLACLATTLGRSFTEAETQEITAKQHAAYRWTFLLSGISHPNVDKALRELSPAGHARVAALANAIS